MCVRTSSQKILLLFGQGFINCCNNFRKNWINVAFSVDSLQLLGILYQNFLGVFSKRGDSCLESLFVVVGSLFGGLGGTFQDSLHQGVVWTFKVKDEIDWGNDLLKCSSLCFFAGITVWLEIVVKMFIIQFNLIKWKSTYPSIKNPVAFSIFPIASANKFNTTSFETKPPFDIVSCNSLPRADPEAT